MSEYLIVNDICKNYINVKNVYLDANKINLLCSYGVDKLITTDISFQTIYDVSNIIQSIKILPIIGNTDNLTIRQDVIDFSHKIVLLLSGSIKNGLWNKNNDMLGRYTSLDYIEYIPKYSFDISNNDYNRECINLVASPQPYNKISVKQKLDCEFTNSNKYNEKNEMDLIYKINNQYSVKTELTNQPPDGLNRIYKYILY
jgi:hypothetical protein